MRIQQLDLLNFKAFEKFTMTLGANAFLVGPNNAGEINPHCGHKSCGRNVGTGGPGEGRLDIERTGTGV